MLSNRKGACWQHSGCVTPPVFWWLLLTRPEWTPCVISCILYDAKSRAVKPCTTKINRDWKPGDFGAWSFLFYLTHLFGNIAVLFGCYFKEIVSLQPPPPPPPPTFFFFFFFLDKRKKDKQIKWGRWWEREREKKTLTTMLACQAACNFIIIAGTLIPSDYACYEATLWYIWTHNK